MVPSRPIPVPVPVPVPSVPMATRGAGPWLLLAAVLCAAAEPRCPSCGAGAERRLLEEAAKRQLLEKLRLRERPRLSHAVPRAAVARAVRRLQAAGARRGPDAEERGYEIISFAEPGGCQSFPGNRSDPRGVQPGHRGAGIPAGLHPVAARGRSPGRRNPPPGHGVPSPGAGPCPGEPREGSQPATLGGAAEPLLATHLRRDGGPRADGNGIVPSGTCCVPEGSRSCW